MMVSRGCVHLEGRVRGKILLVGARVIRNQKIPKEISANALRKILPILKQVLTKIIMAKHGAQDWKKKNRGSHIQKLIL